MILFANFLDAVGTILKAALNFYSFVIVISVVVSWVNADPYNTIVRTVTALTEPVYSRIRRIIPTRVGGLDLTPLVVILSIMFIEKLIVQSLLHYAFRLQAGALNGQ